MKMPIGANLGEGMIRAYIRRWSTKSPRALTSVGEGLLLLAGSLSGIGA